MATSITLKPGETYSLTLKGKGSAGYSWAYEVSGDTSSVAVTITGTGRPPDTGSKQPPATYSVDEQLIVRAVSPGTATIHLRLRRSWEKDKPPLEDQTVKVDVRD